MSLRGVTKMGSRTPRPALWAMSRGPSQERLKQNGVVHSAKFGQASRGRRTPPAGQTPRTARPQACE
eukprot:3777640-Lingulodinium_polyedra.AAC.1